MKFVVKIPNQDLFRKHKEKLEQLFDEIHRELDIIDKMIDYSNIMHDDIDQHEEFTQE